MIEFKPIDLARHLGETITFREDSFICSFGESGREKFRKECGVQGEQYIEWLRAKLARDPRFAVHVWQEGRLVGQMELGLYKADPSCGYINLYYLVPEARGTGLSAKLDDYAVEVFRTMKLSRARLCVSPTNPRAFRFYERLGWRDLGVREDAPEVNFMEKEF